MFVPVGTPGDTLPIRNKTLMGPYEDPKGTNTKGTRAARPHDGFPAMPDL